LGGNLRGVTWNKRKREERKNKGIVCLSSFSQKPNGKEKKKLQNSGSRSRGLEIEKKRRKKSI
jgi:hypothetical protein